MRPVIDAPCWLTRIAVLARIRAIGGAAHDVELRYGGPCSAASSNPSRSGVRRYGHAGPDTSVGGHPGWGEPCQRRADDGESVGLAWPRGRRGSDISPGDCRVLPADDEHHTAD